MENSAEDYRIQSFDLDTQRLLKTALKGQPLTSSCVSFLGAVKKKKKHLNILSLFRSISGEPGESIQHHCGSVFEGPRVQQRGWAYLLHYSAGQ